MSTFTLGDYVGFANLVYGENGGLFNDPPLPKANSHVCINGKKYEVLRSVDNKKTSYEGMVLYDASTNSVIVINRGSQEAKDFITDAGMALNAVSDQWEDAYNLALYASQVAASHPGAVVYDVGHSLGGTLTQLQCASFGFTGITFNAYGAGEVWTALGLGAPNPSANVTNYRDVFDLVSSVSTHIGTIPKTIETADDLSFINNDDATVKDLLARIGGDHSLSNFWNKGDKTGQGQYSANLGVIPNPDTRTQNQLAAISQEYIRSLVDMLASELNITSGNLNSQQDAQALQNDINLGQLNGLKAIMPSDPMLLTDALNPSSDYNAYRLSLVNLSPVVLQDIDPGKLSSFSLWTPGQRAGYTENYLRAKASMVDASVAMAANGVLDFGSIQTDGDMTYKYWDYSHSKTDPVYSLQSDKSHAPVTDVIFGDNLGDNLKGASPNDNVELFGGIGNDTLTDGDANATMEGGAGQDTYIVDVNSLGSDLILDTDFNGAVEKSLNGQLTALTGGDEMGSSIWQSSDKSTFYLERADRDGNEDLDIYFGTKFAVVQDFVNGELGINLGGEPEAVPGLDVNESNSFSPGILSQIEFDDTGANLSPVIVGPSDTSDRVWSIDGSSNASTIYGGVGEERIFADSRILGNFSDTHAIYIQAGVGAQALIGGQGADTLVGGINTLSETTISFTDNSGPGGLSSLPGYSGFDWITGAGGNDLIEGRSGTDLIEGGSGADTIIGGTGFDIIFAGLSVYSDGVGDAAFALLADQNGVIDDVYLTGIDGSGFSAEPSATDNPKANLIIAGSGDAFITGSLGNDTIYAGSGSDTIVGNWGNKTIYGGSGTAIIYASDNEALAELDGTTWQDSGTSYSDTIYGGDGFETIFGSGGSDVINGGSGQDVINVGNGDTQVYAGSGQTTIVGGTGDEVIDAGVGATQINLGSGNNYVYADEGSSTITSSSGNDTVEAGGGNGMFTGGTGSVTYIIGTATGADTISMGTGSTQIRVTGGLDENNLLVRYANSSLVLSDPNSSTLVTINDYTPGSSLTLHFDDGTVWGSDQIKTATMTPTNGDDTLVGWDGNDSIVGGSGNNLIEGVSGNNTLIGGAGYSTIEGGTGADTIEAGTGSAWISGGAGNETYLFHRGDGSSTITPSSSGAGNDVLILGTGIALSDLTFMRIGNDLGLEIGSGGNGSGSSVTIASYFDSDSNSQHVIGQIELADGTSLSQQDVLNRITVFRGDGSDWETLTSTVSGGTYYAGDGADVIVLGGPGNDLIVGGSGHDTLEGGNSGNNTIIAGSGTDFIEGGASNDSISLGAGNATVATSGGNDTISWDGTGQQLLVGYGADEGDFNASTKTGVDTIVIGGGLTLDELTFDLSKPQTQDNSFGADLPSITIGVAGTTGTLTMRELLSADGSGQIGNVVFGDGESLSLAQVMQRAVETSERESSAYIFAPMGQTITVTGANDTVDASLGDDTIVATPGSAKIIVGGADTVVFGRGSGQDFVLGADNVEGENYPIPSGALTVQLAQGVRPEDIEVVAVGDQFGNDPVYYSIRIRGTSDQLNIGVSGNGQSSDTPAPSQISLRFADGTVWDASQLIARSSANEVFFGPESGQDQLSFATPTQVQMAAGVTASQLRFSSDGQGHVVMSLPGSGSTLIFTPNQVSTLNFADGSVVKMSDLLTGMTVAQASGNQFLTDISNGNELLVAQGSGDTLQGGSGNDTLDPGTGNTVMVAGQSGHTTFIYNGVGNDTIQGNANAALQLGAGVSAADISYSVQRNATDGGTDLVLIDTATGRHLVLQDYLGNATASSYQSSMSIQFADGTVVGGSDPSTSSLVDTLGHTVLVAGDSGNVVAAGNDVIFATGSVSIQGGSGSDTIVSGFFDTIDGGAGNDVLVGGGTLLFDKSSGHDSIAGSGYTIQLASDIAPSDIGVRTSSTGSMEIYLLDTGASIFAAPLANFTLAFANGTTWSSSDLAGDIADQGGTVGNDNDLASGTNGATAFTFNAWNNNSTISGYDSGNFVVTFGKDLFGQSIKEGDVTLYENGADLVVKLAQPYADGGSGTEAFTIKDYYRAQQNGDGSTSYVQAPLTLQFADGTTWGNSAIQALIQQGSQDQSSTPVIWLAEAEGQSFTESASTGSLALAEKNQGGNTLHLENSAPGVTVTLDPTVSGADTLVVGSQSNVNIVGFKGSDVVQFAADMQPADLMGEVVWANGGWGLRLSSASNASAAVTIDNYFTSDGSGGFDDLGGSFVFADGTTLGGGNLVGLMDGFDTTGSEPPTPVSIINQLSVSGGGGTLTGWSGNDVLAAGSGDVTVNGAGGNDTLYTGSGNDTFVFGHGAGHDTLLGSAATGKSNVLAFAADVSPSDVSVTRVDAAGTLVITLNDTGETVTLPNYLQDASHQPIQQVTFTDGTVWSAATLASMALQPSEANQYLAASAGNEILLAGSGADTLVADAGNDTLTAGSGSDTLYGGTGTDVLVAGSGHALMLGGSGHETYQFGSGFGSATVVAQVAASNDLQLTGATAAQVSKAAINATDLQLTVQGGGTIVLADALVWGANSAMTVHYADGTSQTLTEILHQLPGYQAASAGNEVLTGGSGADTLVADDGNDTLLGGAGNDTLVAGAGHAVLNAGTGNDLLVGGSGASVFQIGAGAGSDTIVATEPTTGSNVLQLMDDVSGVSFTRPTVPGPETSSVQIVGDNLELILQKSDGSVTTVDLENHYTTGDIDEIQFQDGSTLSMATVDAALSQSAPGSQLQVVAGGDQTVNASANGAILLGGGNDLIHISSNDRIVMPAAFAQDTIDASGGFQDTIAFATGTSPNDISIQQQGGDLILSDAQGGSIDIANWQNESPQSLPTLTFADGSSMTPDGEVQGLYDLALVAAPDNSESITGGSGFDGLSSDRANDTLVGGTGQETFVIADGFGQDVIQLNADAQGNSISLGESAVAQNTVFARNGNDLLISVTGSTGLDGQASTLTLAGYFAGGVASTALGNLTFGDNISLTGTKINQLLSASNGAPTQYTGIVQTAGSGNVELVSDNGIDTLIGGSGDDTLIGGSGRDLIEAGTGNTDIQAGSGQRETIDFDLGFGQDTIENVGARAIVTFGAGIHAGDLGFTFDGPSNIAVSVTGSIAPDGLGSSIEIDGSDWGQGVMTDVTEFDFADGTVLTMAQAMQQAQNNALASEDALHQSQSASTSSVAAGQASQTATATNRSEIDQVTPGKAELGTHASTSLATDGGVGKDVHDSRGALASQGYRGGNTVEHPSAGERHNMLAVSPSLDAGTNAGKGFHGQSAAVAAPVTPEARGVATWIDTGLNDPAVGELLDDRLHPTGAPRDAFNNDINADGANPVAYEQTANRASAVGEDGDLASHGRQVEHGRGLARTTEAANDMAKALAAQGSIKSAAEGDAQLPDAQVKLQDGTLWSVTGVDQMVAALGSSLQHGGSSGMRSAGGNTDLEHMRLVEAMASFGHAPSAETALSAEATSDYAIMLATQQR